MLKRILKIVGLTSAIIVAVVVCYILYVIVSYNRIQDMQDLEVLQTAQMQCVKLNTEYTAITQNCGFGAYSPDFTFFMDGGIQVWANSQESTIANIDTAASETLSFDPDFVFFQEVDTDSTRSYHINQQNQIAKYFPKYDQIFAVNYHSVFLAYPLNQPHGICNSGIMTLSKAKIERALRRSLTVSDGLERFFDLDRCYSVSRIPVENGKELVLYNVHLSAYCEDSKIRDSQLKQLLSDMHEEYENGNYTICGGDFNQDFTGDSVLALDNEKARELSWAQPFPKDFLPEGILQALKYDDSELIPTCRASDVPYGSDCMTFVIDGFLVSRNVKVTKLHNVDTEFAYSDHNPVLMRFVLE